MQRFPHLESISVLHERVRIGDLEGWVKQLPLGEVRLSHTNIYMADKQETSSVDALYRSLAERNGNLITPKLFIENKV